MILDAMTSILNHTTRMLDPGTPADLPDDHILVDFYAASVVVDTTTARDFLNPLLDQLMSWPSNGRGPEADMSLTDALTVMGSAGSVYRLFALGQVLGIWRVVLPPSMAQDHSARTDTVDPDRVMNRAQAARLVSEGAITVADFRPRRHRPHRHQRPR